MCSQSDEEQEDVCSLVTGALTPHAVDAQPGEILDAIVPPFVAGVRGEVDMSANPAFAAAGRPEARHSRIAIFREEGACGGELFVFGVVSQKVRFHVRDDADATSMVRVDPVRWIGEAVLIPCEDVSGMWWSLRDGVAG